MIPPLLQAQGLASVMNSAEFVLPLADLGAGAVDTSLARGTGGATFTRATTAWTKLSTGLWASVASGTARSSYIGLTTAASAYGGYFAEGAGTQLVTPTASIRDMTDASWVKGATMTAALTGTGIDGVVNSCSRLTGGAVAATNTVFQTLTAAASSRTYSVWLKRVTGTGTINLTEDALGTATDVTASLNTNTFTLVSVTASVLNASFGIQIVTNGDVILADFNQFEAGAFATSPMDAAGAVRNGDVLTYPTAGNVLGTIGSTYMEISELWSNSQVVAPRALDLGSNSSALYFSADKLSIFDKTTQSLDTSFTASTSIQKAGSSYGGTTMRTFVNGIAGSGAVFDGDMNIGINLSVGAQNASINQWYGTLKGIRLWQRQLPNAVLQAITT